MLAGLDWLLLLFCGLDDEFWLGFDEVELAEFKAKTVTGREQTVWAGVEACSEAFHPPK